MLNTIINHLLVFSGWSAILLVFLLPALESSVFLGFVIPGETAVVVGGFLAYEHRVSLGGILAAGILGAIIGDSIGFAVGERWGDSLLGRLPKRLVKPEHVVQGKQMITRLGGRAVFAGRWISVLRALVPGLCGTSGMRYPTFLLWNAIGGITWATAFTMLGYLAGSAWQRVEHYTSVASYVILGVILAAIVAVIVFKRRRQHARDAETRLEEAAAPSTNGSGSGSGSGTMPSTTGTNGATRPSPTSPASPPSSAPPPSSAKPDTNADADAEADEQHFSSSPAPAKDSPFSH